jgi:hypothetical protein
MKALLGRPGRRMLACGKRARDLRWVPQPSMDETRPVRIARGQGRHEPGALLHQLDDPARPAERGVDEPPHRVVDPRHELAQELVPRRLAHRAV